MRKLRLLLLISFAILGRTAPVMAQPDPQVQALLSKVEAATRHARTLTADLTKIEMDGTSTEATVQLMKPNFASIVDKNAPPNAALAFMASDGKTLWRYPDPSKSEYLMLPADPEGSGMVDWIDGVPVQSFFGLQQALKNAEIETALKYIGTRTWDGERYQVLQRDFDEEGKRYTAWLYIGQDNLIHRQVGTFYILKQDGTPEMFEVDLKNIKVNTPMRAAQFAYHPPQGAQQLHPKVLLASGTAAPDLSVEDQHGTQVRLSDFRGKVVVLDFWATWCPPCLKGMSHTNAVAAKYKNKNVVVLAVNVWDSKSSFQAWLSQHTQYGALDFAIDPAPQGNDVASTLYNVTGIPTQIIIGKDGKIVTSIVGYPGPTPDLEKGIEAALAN